MNISQKIVKQNEEYCFSPFTWLETIFHIIMWTSACVLIASLLIYKIGIWNNPLAISVMTGAVSLFMLCAIDAKVMKPNHIVLHLLHYILPNKGQRDRELAAYKAVQEMVPSNKELKFIDHEIFNVGEMQEWLVKNVSSVKSILSLCHKRAVHKDKSVNFDFLYWTQLVPYIDNIDVYRQILLCSKVAGTSSIRDLVYLSREDISTLFSLYKDEDLFLLFTSPMHISDYVEVLELGMKYNLTLPIECEMKDLYVSVKEMIRLQEGSSYMFAAGSLKEAVYEDLTLKQISNVKELSDVAKYMQNCLSSKEDMCIKNKTEIYLLKKSHKPFIVFEYKKNRLVEAKLRFNESLSKGEKEMVQRVIELSRGEV